MATFCQKHSIEMFGRDFKELAFEGDPEDFRSDLCETCGYVWVNRDGIALATPPEDMSLYPITLNPDTLNWVDVNGNELQASGENGTPVDPGVEGAD